MHARGAADGVERRIAVVAGEIADGRPVQIDGGAKVDAVGIGVAGDDGVAEQQCRAAAAGNIVRVDAAAVQRERDSRCAAGHKGALIEVDGEVEVLPDRVSAVSRYRDGRYVRSDVIERVELAGREAAIERIAGEVGDARAAALDVEAKCSFAGRGGHRDGVGAGVDRTECADRSRCAAGRGELERRRRHTADILGERDGVVQRGCVGRIGVGEDARGDGRRDSVDVDAGGRGE